MALIECEFPGCAPFNKKNKARHLRRKHNINPPQYKGERWTCPKCGKTFALSQRSRSHRCHSINTTRCFVWTSGMDYSMIETGSYFTDFTIQKPSLGSHTISSVCPFFSQNNFSMLERSLGYGFAFMLDGIRTLHQGVVMMEILKISHSRNVEFKSPDSVERSGSSPVVIILDYDNNMECTERLYKIHSWIQRWSKTKGQYRLFPSISEIDWHNSKVNDILALDEIAFAQDRNSEYAYRPRTCHSYRGERCTLQGQNTVMKASHSSETKHVIHLQSRRHPDLQCYLESNKSQQCNPGPRIYFHQEHIDGIIKLGEFRVIISTIPSSSGLRNRTPNIESIIHTSYRGRHGCTPFLSLTGSEALWKVIKPLSITKLREFACFIFESLRKRPDWQSHYETLEVGVRLDVGVHIGPPARFFVVEITRFQQGSWFPESTAPPGFGCAAAFARALNDYFPPFTGHQEQ